MPQSADEQTAPTVLVVLGGTGDLMRRKIAPALFHLYQTKKLPSLFKVVGVARTPLDDVAYQAQVLEFLESHKDIDTSDESVGNFIKSFNYISGDFTDPQTYKNMADFLGMTEGAWQECSNKLFYLAVPPPFYETIFTNLSESGLTDACSDETGWTRVLVEKPFGRNRVTAQKLDNLLAELFKEVQIYRIDHYLGKEMMQNILAFRFGNSLFEDHWQAPNVTSIEIKLLEELTVKDRGKFYDSIGALRDVGQNHLLQMLAFATMNHPSSFTAPAIRRQRSEIIESLNKPTLAEVKENTYRGQYNTYRKTKDVDPKSNIETYFKIKTSLNHPRWQGIPIYLESGKAMYENRKEIIFNLSHPEPCLCPMKTGEHFHNRVIFKLEPDRGIKIEFLAKKPGLTMEVEPRELEFVFKNESKGEQYVEEYARLVHDAIIGDQTLFVGTKEVQAMWRFIDPIIKAWQDEAVPLVKYKAHDKTILTKPTFSEQVNIKSVAKNIGYIGLGKMGGNMVRNLIDHGWTVTGFNRNYAITQHLASEGMQSAKTIKDLVTALKPPRLIWLMVPHQAVDDVIWGPTGLLQWLQPGDTIIDGGNSNYKESKRRYEKLAGIDINFIDVGVSGGPQGARNGACMMVGGDPELFTRFERLFYDTCVDKGYAFFPGPGAGHFVKMVHNGIEYGMMQAIAEGFNIMKQAPYNLDLNKVANAYEHGSVIESRLMTWLRQAYTEYGYDLENISGSVANSGEGQWTVDTATEMELPVPVIKKSLDFRKDSQANPSYIGKILMAIRNQFGGHDIK